MGKDIANPPIGGELATLKPVHDLPDNGADLKEMMAVAERIARKIARRTPPWIEVDDLISAAYRGLTVAYNKYRPENGYFFSYAEKWIRGAVIDELRVGDIAPRRIRTAIKKGLRENDVPIAVSMDSATHVPDRSVSPEGNTERSQAGYLVREVLKQLPSRLVRVYESIFIEERSLADIGKELGVSSSRVCQLKEQLINTVSELLPNGIGGHSITSTLKNNKPTLEGGDKMVQHDAQMLQDCIKVDKEGAMAVATKNITPSAPPTVVLTEGIQGVSAVQLNKLFHLFAEVGYEVFQTNAAERSEQLGFISKNSFTIILVHVHKAGWLIDEGRGKWRWDLNKIPKQWVDAFNAESLAPMGNVLSGLPSVTEGSVGSTAATVETSCEVEGGSTQVLSVASAVLETCKEEVPIDGQNGVPGQLAGALLTEEAPSVPTATDAALTGAVEEVREPNPQPAISSSALADVFARIERLEKSQDDVATLRNTLIQFLARVIYKEHLAELPPQLQREVLEALAIRIDRH